MNEIQLEGNGNIVIQDVEGSSLVINTNNQRHLEYLYTNHPEIYNTVLQKLQSNSDSEGKNISSSILDKIRSFFGFEKQIIIAASNGDAIYSGGNLTINQEKKFREADLKIVDISITHEEKSPLPKLDIKVRNNSDEVIFIKKVDIICLKSWIITNMPNFQLVTVSWTYDVTVPINGNKISYPISQDVKPNEVDRFELRLKTEKGAVPGVGISPHLIKITLVFNEDNKEVSSQNILVHIPQYITWAGMHNPGMSPEELKSQIDNAKDVLKNIDSHTIIQPDILEVIEGWANIKQ